MRPLGEANAESVFILLSKELFPSLITGFLLAAILSAVMSTIASQLLVSASALTDDFYKQFIRPNASDKELVLVGRLGVLAISVIALVLAFNPSGTILKLVGYAWAGFRLGIRTGHFVKPLLETNDKMGSAGWNDHRYGNRDRVGIHR